MGFGLLFIGYFVATLMSVNMFGSVFRLLGYGIVLFAAGKLNKYNRTFRYLEITSLLMIVLSSILAVNDVWSFMYNELLVSSYPFGESFRTTVGYVEMVAALVFNASMLYSIRCIAIETEVEKIAVNSVRNFVFVCIYYVLYFIAILPFEFTKEYTKYFSGPVLILYFVWIIFNLVLIYSCYARICDESDVDMEQKPSRFAFVNKMRAESEERSRAAAERQAKYKEEKRKKRISRRK